MKIDPNLIAGAVSPKWNERSLALQEALKSKTPNHRLTVRIIARILAQDSDESIRTDAIEALGEFGTRADVRAIRCALSDEAWLVRATAVSALYDLIGARAAKEVFRLTTDRNPIVRRYAWVAYYDAAGEESRPLLEAAMKAEKDPKALVGIVGALASLQTPEALNRLQDLASHPHRAVSSPAQQWLDEFTPAPLPSGGEGSPPKRPTESNQSVQKHVE